MFVGNLKQSEAKALENQIQHLPSFHMKRVNGFNFYTPSPIKNDDGGLSRGYIAINTNSGDVICTDDLKIGKRGDEITEMLFQFTLKNKIKHRDD